MSYILDALKKSENERGQGNIPGVQTVHSSSINYHQQKNVIWPYILIAAILINAAVIAYFIYSQNTSPDNSQPIVKNLPVTSQGEASQSGNIYSKTPATDTSSPDRYSPANASSQQSAHKIISSTTTRVKDSPVTARQENTRENMSESLLNNRPAAPVESRNVEQSSRTQANTEKDTRASYHAQTNNSQHVDKQLIPAPEYPPETFSSMQTTETEWEKPEEQVIEQYDLPEQTQRELPTLTISAHVYSSNPQQRSMIINNRFLEEGDNIMDGLVLHEITPDGAIFDYNGLLFHNNTVSGWQ